MITRWYGDELLIDRKAAFTDRRMAPDGGLSMHTVRAKLAGLEVACDVATRAPLYDFEQASTVLAPVKARRARSAQAQRARRTLAA